MRVTQPTLFGENVEILERLRNPVFTARVGKNGPLFADICRLYVPDGSRVLDMTYGLGNFWTTETLTRYRVCGTDLNPAKALTAVSDMRHLPFRDGCFNAVVLDPPYAGMGSDDMISTEAYGLEGEWTRDRVLDLYARGMREAARISTDSGVVVVKCQDQIRSGKQEWNHVAILELAPPCLEAVDLFVLVRPAAPMRHNYQKHARKNHSYFWVFKKQ